MAAPPRPPRAEEGFAASFRQVQHEITLADDHRVGVAVCGRGLPLVLVHGLSAEGRLFGQTLSGLATQGFRVVAVDMPGHGGTQGLPRDGATLEAYVDLLQRVLARLGIRRAVLAGHSMGGRLVAQVAARDPRRALAVVLIDATLGDPWDRLMRLSRVAPPALVAVGALAALDMLATMPMLRDRGRALRLGRLLAPTVRRHALRPWRLVGPAACLLRCPGSDAVLDDLAAAAVPVAVLHGDRDLVVPHRAAVDAARRAGATLVTVRRGTHSWVLDDPETLPVILSELLDGPLRRVRADAVVAAGGVPPATPRELEAALLEPHALLRRLAPPPGGVLSSGEALPSDGDEPARRPRYRWHVTSHSDRAPVR